MVKGKLILICQSGGVFVKNEDGSLKYNGGEAQAINVDSDTLFDNLKLKLADVCNLDFKSVAVKYFLPGNTRTLINMSNDKELRRMLDFHRKSVTVDVFLSGTAGFNRDSANLCVMETSIREAESANRVVFDPDRAVKSETVEVSDDWKKATATQKKLTTTTSKKATSTTRAAKSETKARAKRKHFETKSVKGVVATTERSTSETNASDESDTDSGCGSGYSIIAIRSLAAAANKVNATTSSEVDISASPADTVKKRRRVASLKFGVNTVPDDGESGRPRKRKSQSLVVAEEFEPMEEYESDEDDFRIPLTVDGSLEKLIASWKKGITRVGQDFSDVAEFRDVLRKYALAHRFTYKLKKNEATRVSARCVIESCSWNLFASWIPTDNAFRIKKFNKLHSCEGKSWKSGHPNRRIFVNFIREKLRDSPHQKVKDIANSLSRDFGFELNLSQVRRGINDAREQIQGSYQEAYNQLSFYCEEIAQANPLSFVKIETNEEKRFQRLFISFNASIHGFESGCRPLLFLEATSMKSKCKEKLLTATTLDGNDGLFPIAFSIVENEDDDSWYWFLEMLRSALATTSGPVTFVFDREKGLKEVVLGVFEDAHIGYSIYHLLQRFMRSVKRPFQGQGRSSLPGYFIAAAQAIRFNVFKSFIEKIMKVSPDAYDWLMQVEPQYWASTSFKGEPYNHITQNVAESYVKLMEENRESTITYKLQVLIHTMSELLNSRRGEMSTWSSKLTPPKEEKLREEFSEACGLKVLFSSDTLFEVRDEVSHVVNLNIRECTCLMWQRTGIPCRHAIAVFNCTSRNIYDYCSRFYTTHSCLLAYSKSINHVDRPAEIEEPDKDTVLILPPRPSRAWLSESAKRPTKTLGKERTNSSNGGHEDGKGESLSLAEPEAVGEGNLTAALDSNGQVRDHHESGDVEDCHEVKITGDLIASLDDVMEVACEVVNHEATTKANRETGDQEAANNVATIDDISEDGSVGDHVALFEANHEASLVDNWEGKSEADHEVFRELFDEANHEIFPELFGEPNSLASHEVNGTHGVTYETIRSINDEASQEVDTIASTEVKTNVVNYDPLGENNKVISESNNGEDSFEADLKASFEADKENEVFDEAFFSSL